MKLVPGPRGGESLKSWGFRKTFNLWPCYFGTGGKVVHIAGDWTEARVRLPLTPRTRNYVGTIFGGSMYGCIDPIYMLLLVQALGRDYIVWDKAAEIRFLKPGRSTLEAVLKLPEGELDAIRAACAEGRPVDRLYDVELKDAEGKVCASIKKTVYIRRKVTSPRG